MTHWNDADLAKVGAAEELDLESERADGTLRDPVTMWVVRAGDQIDRSVNTTRAGVAFSDPNNVPVGPINPAPRFVSKDFWAHGANAGLELRY